MQIPIIRASISWMVVAACVPAADDLPAQDAAIAGRVHGLWDGTDGVVLRLHADGGDVLHTVSTNGPFHFDAVLPAGSPYAVTVAASPAMHDCVIEHGGSGVVASVSAPSVSVACTGPEVGIAFSAAWGWSFDPTQEVQTFAGPLAAQDVALTVSGAATTQASVDGAALVPGQASAPIALPLGSRSVPVRFQASSGLSKRYELVFERAASVLTQVAYGKASNPDVGDNFGQAISLSGDTLVVGAASEGSAARGINGNQADNSKGLSGAVYVFVRNGATWSQQAYLKASNTDSGDAFGNAVALSGDTLVVGAPFEQSNSASNQATNSADRAGAAYVFVRTGTTWSQQAYLKAFSIRTLDFFGRAVAVSGDTLAVGAPGSALVTGSSRPGTVYVFQRSGTGWTQQAAVRAANGDNDDMFGQSVALSGDTLAVGAPGEDGAATGVDGDQNDNSATDAGAAYVFQRTGQTWAQQGYLKASNTMGGAMLGSAISLSDDTLAVAANRESAGASQSGAAFVFVRSAARWAQQAYLKASNVGAGDNFGDSIALSGDQLVVGATSEASIASGINGDQNDNSAQFAGAAYLFAQSGGVWTQQAYIKASNTNPAFVDPIGDRRPVNDRFGAAVALSAGTLVVGASNEFGGSAGFNGDQADNSKRAAGAIYVFQQ